MPTVAKVLTGGYQEIEPVFVVDVFNGETLKGYLRDTFSHGNPILDKYSYSENKEVAVLKNAGIKSYSTFVRQSETWHIVINDGRCEIRGQKRRPDRGWEPDKEKRIVFPTGSSQEDLIERMVEILQEAAGR